MSARLWREEWGGGRGEVPRRKSMVEGGMGWWGLGCVDVFFWGCDGRAWEVKKAWWEENVLEV